MKAVLCCTCPGHQRGFVENATESMIPPLVPYMILRTLLQYYGVQVLIIIPSSRAGSGVIRTVTPYSAMVLLKFCVNAFMAQL